MNADPEHATRPDASKKAIQDALEASRKLQQALTRHVERLEAKLKSADELLEAADIDEGEDDPEPEVLIPDAKKAAGLFLPSEFLNPTSPFYEEATKRTTYITNTRPHPMKAKDIETLALAVRRENERLQAYKRTQVPDSNLDLDKNLEGLDWTTIAEKVSDSSSVKRTPTECRVIWVGDQHPSLNHGQWPNSELDKLNAIVQEYTEKKNPVDWVNVAELLGNNRTPIDCMRHGTPQHRHNWTAEADQKLLHAVECSGIDNWQLVARKVSEYVTPSQCQGRWQKTLNPALKRRTWTTEEDERLRKAVAGYGNSWVQVAAAIPGRTNDQCRERWTEYLRPCATGVTWTEAEDIRLLELVENHGNKWALISSTIGNNKTGQNCRLHYEKLKKKKHANQGLVAGMLSPMLPATLAGPGASHIISNQEQASFISVIGPVDGAQNSDFPGEALSCLKGRATSVNSTAGLAPQASLETVPVKPQPKPKPRRFKKAGQDAGFLDSVADIESDTVPPTLEGSSQAMVAPGPAFTVDTETSSNVPHAASAPTAMTSAPTDAAPLSIATRRGEKRQGVGQGKKDTSRHALKNLVSSNPEPVQDNEGDEPSQSPLKKMRKKRASASTGRRVNLVDSKNDLGNPDVHPSEEVGQASSELSTNRKRKPTEDQVAQTAPKKKARVTKSKAGNPNNSTANQVVSPEPSYDVSQLRRGRSRKLLLPSD